MKKIYCLFLSLILISGFTLSVSFKTYGQYVPSQCMKLVVYEPYGISHTHFPARIQLNTQVLVSAGLMQADGDDIRFSTGCPENFLPYWIETGINQDSTVIWIRLDQLQANDSVTVWMYFGDTLAPGASDFSNTFPDALITSGNTYTGNVHHYGWLKINSGNTLYVNGGQSLTIYAEYVEINGTIDGTGSGYTSPSPTLPGNGPGGGGYSTNSGCGGGGYGGAGGLGGYDSGDTPGIGGASYGTTSGSDIEMGSGGGSSDNTPGGNGGGCVTIISRVAVINGQIIMDGNDATQPGSSRGGGGGAGGGIKITSDHLSISGTLSAKGGAGSPCTSTANDSGGGGGGGRIKLFHGSGYNATGTMNVSGGIGGPYGSPPAMPGTIGTVQVAATTFKQNIIYPAQPFGSLTNIQHYLCPGDSILVNGTWYIQAAVVYDTLINMLGCDSVVQVSIIPVVVDTAIILNGITLTAQAAYATFQWFNCTTNDTMTGITGNSFTPGATGLYACIVTQNGCSAMSSCYPVTISNILSISRKENLQVFPNPVNEILYIGIPDHHCLSPGMLQIFNLQGDKLYDTRLQPNLKMAEVDVSKLPAGIYVGQLVTDNGSHFLFRFVKGKF